MKIKKNDKKLTMKEKNKYAKKPENFAAVHIYTHGTLKNKRIMYLDILNIIAILAVIAMHCNGLIHGNPNKRAWNTSLIIECICYFAVPLFFMISGANLMKYRERYDTKEFYKKRCKKVLIPFIIWAIIMFVWKIFIIKTINIQSVNSPIKFINAFFSNKEELTYYFMFEIMAIYLIMPLLSLLTKEEYKKTLWFTVGLYFMFNATIPNITPLIGIKLYDSFKVPLNGYIIYVFLGYLLSETSIEKKKKIYIYVGALVGLIYRYITTYILSKTSGHVVKTTWGYGSWHCMLLTISIFIFVKDLNINNKIRDNERIQKATSKIAGCSFGIYLIHMIVKYYYINIFNINTEAWQFRTFGILVIYCICLLIVMVLKKIPIIKKALP